MSYKILKIFCCCVACAAAAYMQLVIWCACCRCSHLCRRVACALPPPCSWFLGLLLSLFTTHIVTFLFLNKENNNLVASLGIPARYPPSCLHLLSLYPASFILLLVSVQLSGNPFQFSFSFCLFLFPPSSSLGPMQRNSSVDSRTMS